MEENYRYLIDVNRRQLKALAETCEFAYHLHSGIMLPTLMRYGMKAYARHYLENYHCDPDDITSQTARLYQYIVEIRRLGWGIEELNDIAGGQLHEYKYPLAEPDETTKMLLSMQHDFEQALRLRKGDERMIGDVCRICRYEYKPRQPRYQVEVSHRQLRELSHQCEQHSRFITGQLDYTLQETVESAWETRYAASHPPKDNGYPDRGIGTTEWWDMRHRIEAIINDIRHECWFCTRSSSYGIHYNDESDLYWDMYEVFRHQLWEDRPDDKKLGYTVDAYPAHGWSNDPLVRIGRIEE